MIGAMAESSARRDTLIVSGVYKELVESWQSNDGTFLLVGSALHGETHPGQAGRRFRRRERKVTVPSERVIHSAVLG
jgi:hypothetical protein